MLILSAAAPVDRFTPLWPSLWLGIAAAAAVATGVFRRRSIVGPARIDDNEPLEPLTVTIFCGLAAFLACSLVAARLFQKPDQKPASLLDARTLASDLFARVVLVAVMLWLNHLLFRKPKRLGLTATQFFPGILRGLFSLIIVLPLMLQMLLLTDHLWKTLHVDGQFIHPALQLLGDAQSAKLRFLLLLSIVVASPFSEEVFFRGFLQTLVAAWLGQWASKSMTALPRWGAVVLVSFVFAWLHPWWSRPPIFVLSVCLGYLYERTGNLWTAILVHAMFNAAEVTVFFQTGG